MTGNKQATVVGGSDIYISSFGTHYVKLNRYMRDEAVFCIDPEYVGVAYLRPMTKKDRLKPVTARRR